MKSLLGVGCSVLVLVLATTAGASSHREAPLITEDPVADNTDTYAFVDPKDDSKVVIIANWIPLEDPAGGPNFHMFGEEVRYDINVDNDGDAEEDIVYELRFRTPSSTRCSPASRAGTGPTSRPSS